MADELRQQLTLREPEVKSAARTGRDIGMAMSGQSTEEGQRIRGDGFEAGPTADQPQLLELGHDGYRLVQILDQSLVIDFFARGGIPTAPLPSSADEDRAVAM